MGFPLPDTLEELKSLIGNEISSLRSAVRRTADRPAAPTPGSEVTAPVQTLAPAPTLPVRDAADPSCLCSTHDSDATGTCSLLHAIPASAVLLEPVHDETGAVRDFRIVAGNRIRSAEWLEAPDRQVGQRFLEARPGAAASGLLAGLADVVAGGGPLEGRVVDYTEQRLGRLHRAPLLYSAARCGEQVLATWRPVQSHTELLTIDAQYLASLGWGNWDLLSGKVTWSEGLSRIFHAEIRMPWTLDQLCDALLPGDLNAFSEFLASVLAGEEPAWTRIRFLVLGEVRTLDLLGRPVAGTDGRPWAVNLVARDLTPQIRSRRRIAETERESDWLRRQAQAERRVADALREALVPTHSEALAAVGLTVAASYRPAEEDAAVGGDWYKCRLLPDGRVLVAIGDAAGHGLEAVARMSQQRHALAGLAQTGASAGEITTWLNDLICGDPVEQTATVVAGHIDSERTLHWADAGHPAPLLLRDGHAAPLRTSERGPLLGALPGYAYETTTTPLRRGDLLLLYTDGIVERRGEDVTKGIDRLAALVARDPDPTPQDLIGRILADPEQSGLEDDACMLAIRLD
ncbi:PP2C family protein-serine/threonine phosphatase [Streptomyces hydrogenans]|uniref:PP2C family protein-serine/threonine phosphatase n=1 Tax=Streptomyces hydrogenans TaxID=1873719 RepID=UPI0036BE4B47